VERVALNGFEAGVERFLKSCKPNTRRTYTAAYLAFEEFSGESVLDFLRRAEEDMKKEGLNKSHVARTTLADFVTWLESKKKANKTIRVYVGAIQGLAKYYDLRIGASYINLPPSITIHKKHPWTIEEIGNFISQMNHTLYKSIAATIVQSGLSLADLLELKYGDIKDEFEKGVTPLCVDLTRKKTSIRFLTFIGKWGVSLLKEHLNGKRLTDKTPIYDVCDRAVHAYFRRVGAKFGNKKLKGRNPYTPHSLRAAFRTILSDHQIDHIIIEFWMGHSVPEQQIVYVSKSREGWRETYRTQAEPWLTPPQFRWIEN
jgi:integrase